MSTRNFTEAGLFLPVRVKKRGESGKILIQQKLRVNSYDVIGKMKVDKCGGERESKSSAWRFSYVGFFNVTTASANTSKMIRLGTKCWCVLPIRR
jgi:hypothetical protein